MITRRQNRSLVALLAQQPAVALLGPRQAGKTTLAQQLGETTQSVYVDLELPSGLAQLADPEYFFAMHRGTLVILDEIQRLPEIFRVLRGSIDQARRQGHSAGQFLLLGSASLELLRQTSESLAGRISFMQLNPLDPTEVSDEQDAQRRLWLRGGFATSYLSSSDVASFRWRNSFLQTYLERDIPMLGPRVPAETLRRLWTMLAHLQGTTLNVANLARALEVSQPTVARYIDLMVDLFLLRRLSPWISNVGKRLVKAPKIYIRDSGLTHALLGIQDMNHLLAHPVVGASWEGHVLENTLAMLPVGCDTGFYRTATGDEVDLVVRFPEGRVWAIEVKKSTAPSVEKGFHQACKDIRPDACYVVYPGSASFSLGQNVIAIGLPAFLQQLRTLQEAYYTL